MKFLPSLFLIGFFLIFSCSDRGDDSGVMNPCTPDDCGVLCGDNSTCNISYSKIQSIFDSNCTSCHGNQGGLNLTSYSNLISGGNSGTVIISSNSSESLLWQKINSRLMPPSGSGLLSDEITLIATWIEEGAKDN